MSEKISSFFDNEIENSAIDNFVSKKDKGKNLRKTINDYQIIRDVMRKNSVNLNNLTDKIIKAIEKEPTQLSGLTPFKKPVEHISRPSEYWPIAASFAALFVIGLTVFNSTVISNSSNINLVKEDIPEDIIAAHYASTSTNMNYFIKTGVKSK